MLSIRKEFSFSASHELDFLEEEHPCGRVHGHNYVVEVELGAPKSKLNAAGFVRDYRDLSPLKKWIDETLDHRHLNHVLPGINPSAEHLAVYIYDTWREHFPELTAVAVSETPKTWAEYRPDAD